MSGNVPATGGAVRITRDDDRARRVCSLALDFMNAASPLSSSEIARTHYPGLSSDSFRKAFSRDRQTLASCGLAIVERRVPGEESLWEADSARSFARGAEISPTDGAALELACRPLVDDPAFPLADELRLALAKVSRAFSETLSTARSRERGSSRALDALRSCLAKRTVARVTYVNARGETSERMLAPFGFFALRGTLYLVADRLDDDGAPTGDPRTYRVDRVTAACLLPETTFSIPEGFSVANWRRLPFQMGPTTLEARFVVGDDRAGDVERAAGTQGSFAHEGDALVWTVAVSDELAAARWAVAAGIRPLAPESLVTAWSRVLEEVLDDGR